MQLPEDRPANLTVRLQDMDKGQRSLREKVEFMTHTTYSYNFLKRGKEKAL